MCEVVPALLTSESLEADRYVPVDPLAHVLRCSKSDSGDVSSKAFWHRSLRQVLSLAQVPSVMAVNTTLPRVSPSGKLVKTILHKP